MEGSDDRQGGEEGVAALGDPPHGTTPAEGWWGQTFHLTPGDVHAKHYEEPNDRNYDS
jgi:hypothetical protein